jgi:tetratricopeptide (TPR) repeat protein
MLWVMTSHSNHTPACTPTNGTRIGGTDLQPSADGRSLREFLLVLLRKTWFLWAIAATTAVVKLYTLRLSVPESVRGIGQVDLSAVDRVRVILSVLAHNLSNVVFPHELTVRYPAVVPDSLLHVSVIAGLAMGIALLTGIRLSRHNPLLLLGLLWFGLALAPSAQVLPHHIFRADRFLYQPLVGLSIAACGLMVQERARRVLIPLLIMVVLAFTGLTLRQLPVWTSSITLFSHCLTLHPADALAHNNLGAALTEKGRLDDAVRHYLEAIRLVPEYAEAFNNLGYAYQALGQNQRAIQCYEKALTLKKTDAEVYHNMGVALDALGRADEAADYYHRAIADRPSMSKSLNNLGLYESRQGKLDDAVALYRRALIAQPGFVDAMNNLAVVMEDLGKKTEAEALYRQILEANPRQAETHANLGLILVDAGRTNEGIDHLRRSTELMPSLGVAHYRLAQVLVRTGVHTEAADHYRLAIVANPDDPSPRIELAELLAGAGRTPTQQQESLRLIRQLEDPRLVPPTIQARAANVYVALGLASNATDCARRALVSATALGDTTLAASIRVWLDAQASAAGPSAPRP